jgi:Acetyltransferase (GNAT) family
MRIDELRSVEPKDSLGMLTFNSNVMNEILNTAEQLPNSPYFYSVIPSRGYQSSNDEDVCLISPDKKLIGVLTVQIADDTAYVKGVEISKDMRGKGLATSLYGIVLSILNLNLVSDSTQTPGGARTWVSLSKIPNVSVMGLMYHPSPEEIKTLGARSLQGNASYVFPITVVNNNIVPANSSETKLYSPTDTKFKLIAFYNNKGI